MIINIPLSTELLMWWMKNAKMEDYTLSAPLPIRLDFADQRLDFAKAKVTLECDYEGNASVKGRVMVSSDNPKAQARMFGLEFVRDQVEFKLTQEEDKAIRLMCEAAQMVAVRAAEACGKDGLYAELFNDAKDSDDE